MNVGPAIKKARKALGLSQEELAEKANITQTTISQIEMGKKRPHPETLSSIAKALNTPEGLIHILGIEKKDVPKKKHELYDKLFPVIEDLIVKIIKA